MAVTHIWSILLSADADAFWVVCLNYGVAAVNAAPYGSGILAKGPGAYPRYMYQDAPQSMLTRARQMEAICKRYGVPLGAAALQYSLRDRRITSTIVGISRPERLAQTLELAQHPIPTELWTELAAIQDRGISA